MKRLLACLALLMLSAGCAQRGAPFSNPFIGSEVVPPPGTRGLAPGQAEPYYGPPTQYSPPVIVEPTSQFAPPANGPDVTPVAFDAPRLASGASRSAPDVRVTGGEQPIRVPDDQRRVRFEPPGNAMVASNVASPAIRQPAEPITVRQIQNELANTTSSAAENYGPWREPVVATAPASTSAQPYYLNETPVYSAPVGCYACEPSVTVTGPQTVEITELPPPGTQVLRRTAAVNSPTGTASRSSRGDSFVAASPQSYRRDEQVRLAGGVTAESGGSAQLLRTVGDSTPRTWARYGYDDSYAWLQGRLEYLRATGQWKLRYIPVDGVTDQFGGSVVLDDADGLAGLRPGDFVRVEGRIDSNQATAETLSPPYRVARLQPLAE